MIAFDTQLLRGAVTHADLKPLVVIHAPRGGASCRGCKGDFPAGHVLVASKAWSAVEACCCVECLLEVVRKGCVEAAADWAAGNTELLDLMEM